MYDPKSSHKIIRNLSLYQSLLVTGSAFTSGNRQRDNPSLPGKEKQNCFGATKRTDTKGAEDEGSALRLITVLHV